MTGTGGRITVSRRGAVALLTIDHVEKHNALRESMRAELSAAMQAADDDAAVRAIVLTGAGDRAFAAGGDIGELARRTLEEQRRVMAGGSVFGAVRRVRTPIVAAINGVCLGGGLELALSCDIRIAASHAKFGQPEVAIGLIPGGGATQLLPRVVGMGAALRLVLTGEAIGAEEALRIGLVSEVVAGDVLLERALAVADTIAARAPLAVAAAKEATRAALDLALEEGRQLEVRLFERCFASEDRVEGVRAFLSRATPEFRGR
jgi:enoyl-CoA hydratase